VDLVTIACKRDIQDLLLQAHSIDKFIEKPITHYVTVEDTHLSLDQWQDILSPYYTKHTLRLNTYRRDPTLDAVFADWGRFGHGWRRQQYLKLLTTSDHVISDHALVLDSKNLFVRPTDLYSWPVKHGNGAYLTRDTIFTGTNHDIIQGWLLYFSEISGKQIPDKFGRLLETPFVFEKKIVQQMAEDFDLEALFLNQDVTPNSEFHTYMFYVDPDELPEEKDIICNAISPFDMIEGRYDQSIRNDVERCLNIDSPTHGLHKTVRENLPSKTGMFYTEWLLSLGLNDELVKQYMDC
jgi:hypothetical protein